MAIPKDVYEYLKSANAHQSHVCGNGCFMEAMEYLSEQYATRAVKERENLAKQLDRERMK